MPLTMNHDLIEWVSHEEKPGCQGYSCCLHTENLVIYNHKNQMLDSSMGMYQIIRSYPLPQKIADALKLVDDFSNWFWTQVILN